MIYTVTFNPSLDYVVTMPDFTMGMTNRTTGEQLFPGGKGINVSIVLRNLGIENTALGFIAGFTGEKIERETAAMGLCTDFIRVGNGFSRINVKLKNYDGTEINGMGPDITKDCVKRLYAKLDGLKAGDVLVLAGSIPKCLPDTIYSDILERLSGKGVLSVVDATGDLLLNVLRYEPFLVKPNMYELGEIFGAQLRTSGDVIPYARKLRERGAQNVLVSMSAQGAVFVDAAGDVHELPAPEGTLVNAVGAGDSMVAGFLAGWIQRQDYGHAFRMGISAGSASAFSEYLASRDEVEAVYKSINFGEKE